VLKAAAAPLAVDGRLPAYRGQDDDAELGWRLDPTSPHRLAQVRGHDQPVVILCSEVYTSSLAAAALHDLGLHRATDVVGGYHAWARSGLPATNLPRAVDRSGQARAP
jgi:rhodanese-related sulfurtransferase